MFPAKELFNILISNNIDFFTGVPDSLLKDFCAYLADKVSAASHIITANEGNAIALAAGYYLANNKIGLVYMQNSGIGNAVNPLTSLTDKDVYGIPVLLMIGWRGEPGKKDEPQHLKQGKITLQLLETLGIPFEILPNTPREAADSVKRACEYMRDNESSFALIVRKQTFEQYRSANKHKNPYQVSREDAIKIVVDGFDVGKDIVVSTTGKTSRELFEHRYRSKQSHKTDFLTVGSMGHASLIALGASLKKTSGQVYCLDGDGAAIMHLGALATLGSSAPSNYKHIIFNNGCHDSVGGQPTAGFSIDFVAIARAAGYKAATRADTAAEIREKIKWLRKVDGPALLEIMVSQGARKDLGRPTLSPFEIKRSFMEHMSK